MAEILQQKDNDSEPQKNDITKRECISLLQKHCGAFLKNARVEAGYTQEETECILDEDQKSASRHETGRNFPTLTGFIGYLILFDVTDISSFLSSIPDILLEVIFGPKLTEELAARNKVKGNSRAEIPENKDENNQRLSVLISHILCAGLSVQQMEFLDSIVSMLTKLQDK